MSPAQHIRRLLSPDSGRWQPMLMGLAICAAVGGAAVLLQPPRLVEAIMVSVAMAAWCVGACAMVGYVRWYFASEIERAKQESADSDAKRK